MKFYINEIMRQHRKEFCLQTNFGGEICLSEIITHKGHFTLGKSVSHRKLLSHGQQHFPMGKIANVTESNSTFPNKITDRVI